MAFNIVIYGNKECYILLDKILSYLVIIYLGVNDNPTSDNAIPQNSQSKNRKQTNNKIYLQIIFELF